MRIWGLVFAGLVWAVVLGPGLAQTLQSIGGPAEVPPASFQGQQYVDSRGCVFMRAGLGGRVAWVPRIDRNRQPICNQVVAATRMTDAPAGETIGKPMATVASNIPMRQQMGVQVPVTVPGLAPQAKFVQAPRPAACPATAPVLQRMALAAGGVVTVCTRGDGTATGWVSPRYKGGVGMAIDGGAAQVAAFSGNVSGRGAVQPAIPPGYRAAWTDDRLNPHRGQGSAMGWAAQDQIWTRKTPAQAVEAQSFVAQDTRISVSTMSSTPQSAPGSGRYVQIGSFGDPNNAARAKGSLASAGLPVASVGQTKGGRELMTVLAGPFAAPSDAVAALNIAHDLGYADAFLR